MARPLAWDDIDLDKQPDLEGAGSTKPSRRNDDTANEIEHLASFGIAEREIASRLNRSTSYVHAILTGRRSPGWRQHLEETA